MCSATSNSQNAQLTFEVASVKPCQPNDRRPSRIYSGPGTKDPERFTAVNISFFGLIEYAYDLKPHQRSYQPWMDDESFDVTAKVPAGATPEECKLMLQNLLVERFNLQFHVETKQMPIYELVIAKSGPKLKESTRPRDEPQPTHGVIVGPDGFPVLPPGNRPMALVSVEGKVSVRAYAESAKDIAARLALRVHRPVIDSTGLKGKYDYTLHYDLNADRVAAMSALTSPPYEASPAESERGPSVFVAIRNELGLQLKPNKGPVPMFVIDGARKTPTEN